MTGTLTAADLKVAGGITDFAGAVAAIRAGGTYVNLHTAANPGGEIRGQLVPAANIPQFTILADNPAGVPAGKFWTFNDYFPRVATIASGTTISFAILGFHTATLLPAGMTAKQDNIGSRDRRARSRMTRNRIRMARVTRNSILARRCTEGSSPTCGTILEPCVFDGSKVISSGAPNDPTAPPFAVKVNAPAGNYIFHCRIHPLMTAALIVLAAGSTDVDNPATAAAATATQTAADVVAGTAAEKASSKAAVRTNPNGTKTYTLRAGTSTSDGRVAVLEFLPRNINIKKGDTVVWRPLDRNEPHTVTFPTDIGTDTLILCEGPNGDTPATPTKNPPTGPTGLRVSGRGATRARARRRQRRDEGEHAQDRLGFRDDRLQVAGGRLRSSEVGAPVQLVRPLPERGKGRLHLRVPDPRRHGSHHHRQVMTA